MLNVALLMSLAGIQTIHAQNFPGKELLSTINSFDNKEIGLNDEQSKEIKDLHSDFVDKASGIINGKKSKDKKIFELKKLRNDSNKKLGKVLDDKTLKKYKKSIKKKIRPFKRKVDLIKFLL